MLNKSNQVYSDVTNIVSLTHEENELIKAVAEKEGTSKTKWIENAIREKLNEVRTNGPQEGRLRASGIAKLIKDLTGNEITGITNEVIDFRMLELSDQEVIVIQHSYGINVEKITQDVLGKQLNCSTGWVGQIKRRALRKLRLPSRTRRLLEQIKTENNDSVLKS